MTSQASGSRSVYHSAERWKARAPGTRRQSPSVVGDSSYHYTNQPAAGRRQSTGTSPGGSGERGREWQADGLSLQASPPAGSSGVSSGGPCTRPQSKESGSRIAPQLPVTR